MATPPSLTGKATSRPSSAPLFVTAPSYASDAEAGGDPLVPALSGTHQFLGHQANHHDDQPVIAPNGNRVQAGQLPQTSGPAVGAPDAIGPAGRGFSDSLIK